MDKSVGKTPKPTFNQRSTNSFTKSHRLLKPKDFKQVFDHTSLKIHTSHLLFFVYIPVNLADVETFNSRLGLAFAKKKIKRAHERNRLKRLLREYFRHYHYQLPCAVDIVVIAKQDITNYCNADLTRQIALAFDQIQHKLLKLPKGKISS